VTAVGKALGGTSPANILQLAEAPVLDENGVAVKLGRLWQAQTTIFVFLRHFGCIACRGHAVDVWANRDKYQAHGAKIIFIGNGNPQFIKMFKEDLNLEGAAVYTDPTLASFRAAGFKRGFLAALGPQAIANALKLYAQGHRQVAVGKASGDLWQLGGIVVVKPGGHVAYHYISEALGDFPPHQDADQWARPQ
jgi:peroxiredoxin